MKKNWILGMAVCGILSVSDSAYGQSIKDILNSAAVKDAVTTVTGGKKLTVENLAGTWTYVNPAIQLEGDNALKNVAASGLFGDGKEAEGLLCENRNHRRGIQLYV